MAIESISCWKRSGIWRDLERRSSSDTLTCAGISFQIKNKVAVNINIAGKAFDSSKDYVIALADYVANGGDDCVMLKDIAQQGNGYLFRDAVLNYFSKLNKEGKQVTASIENRITNAE